MDHVGTTIAFADQAGKLAGKLFPLSLPSYAIFLYFLSYKGNNTPKQAMFGFQFLLLFVASTVFTGIVTKGTYSSTLADVDWLHGAAEALLTTTNLYVASGFRNAMAGEAPPEGGSFRSVPAVEAGTMPASAAPPRQPLMLLTPRVSSSVRAATQPSPSLHSWWRPPRRDQRSDWSSTRRERIARTTPHAMLLLWLLRLWLLRLRLLRLRLPVPLLLTIPLQRPLT